MKSTALRIHILAITFSVVLCSSIGFYGDDDDSDERQSALDVFQTAAKRYDRRGGRQCRLWGQTCDNRKKNERFFCCKSYYCKCSLWNCRCARSLFGK
ncbi:uncharacterized protein LOC141914719 isoform X2 [Tubulanus polymorphus]|uniref:uncharacterized protein LOC141914719 isoform X2 n=1 Tax=Tubulanus polymorphus TaxID=672921 RepID=UPI003DA44DE4